MDISKSIQKTLETNKDVDNAPSSSKQDCTYVVHISIFFDGTGNNKEADEAKKEWSNPARLWRNALSYVED